MAVSNSVIGLLLLATGRLMGALSFLEVHAIVLVPSEFGLAGVAMARSLPEVE